MHNGKIPRRSALWFVIARLIRAPLRLALLLMLAISVQVRGAVTLPPASTTEGYVCLLLINEVPFPGERAYQSEQQTAQAMECLLHVLDCRLRYIPPGYTQQQIAAVRASSVIDIITAGGEKGQFDGFYRDNSGKPVTVPRVTERVANLIEIAGRGQPGKFARLLQHAADVATAYVKGNFAGFDPHASVNRAEGAVATGHAYAWMSDDPQFHPGGNFLRIPDEDDGSLGGNRFFTLRRDPK